MSAQFYAISFIILVILANWAIRLMGDWLYPDRIGVDREGRQANGWKPLTDFSRGANVRLVGQAAIHPYIG